MTRRWLQSEVIMSMSKKAEKRVREECDRQVYAAWMMLEEKRSNVQKVIFPLA